MPHPYRDSQGRALTDYPRPSVAVDTAVLTALDGELAVLLSSVDGEWTLPGTFLHEGERLADAVLRSLRAKVGVSGLRPKQLHVFDAPARDDRGWVLSVAHLDVVPSDLLPASGLFPVSDLPTLRYDHEQIIDVAVESLRAEYRAAPDPRGLVMQPFTLSELRSVHETVLGISLQPDTFRRSMMGALRATGEVKREGRGRPGELYERIATAEHAQFAGTEDMGR